jgi:hypothetical protein
LINPANGWGSSLALTNGSVAQYGSIQFIGNYIWGPVNYVVYSSISGNSNLSNVIIADNYGNVNVGSTSPYYAVSLVAGNNITVVNNVFRNFAGIATLGTAVNNLTIHSNNGNRGNFISQGGSAGTWTGAAVAAANDIDWAVEATCSAIDGGVTSIGAIIARVDNPVNVLTAFFKQTTPVGFITTDGSSTNYGTSSDYRLKENIEPATNGLNTINAIRPVKYNWKNNPDIGTITGVIAHEIQEIIPQAVHGIKDAVNTDESIKPQQVDYSQIVPFLIAAIQELSTEIVDLKSKLPTT